MSLWNTTAYSLHKPLPFSVELLLFSLLVVGATDDDDDDAIFVVPADDAIFVVPADDAIFVDPLMMDMILQLTGWVVALLRQLERELAPCPAVLPLRACYCYMFAATVETTHSLLYC